MKKIILAVTLLASITTFSSDYVNDNTNNYLSGQKAAITNVLPEKVLGYGKWFKPSPKPRPFKVNKNTKLSDEMRKRLAKNFTDGFLVIKDDEIVNEYLRYGYSNNQHHLIHSVGKSFVSFAMQPTIDHIGERGLNVKLNKYLPKLKGKFFGESTLGQALDMKNGMEWTENYEDPTTATMLSATAGGWEDLEGKKPESWYLHMFDFNKHGEHGKTWVYNNSAVVASSFAASAIEGVPVDKLVQNSYDSMGFEDSSYFVSNRLDELSAEGGQAISLRDLAKLGRAMIEIKDSGYVNAVWNNTSDINDPADATFLKKYESLGFTGYKYYWYNYKDGGIFAMGSGGQFIYANKEKNIVIVKQSSFEVGQDPNSFITAIEIINDIANEY